jgi:hypothetical protein
MYAAYLARQLTQRIACVHYSCAVILVFILIFAYAAVALVRHAWSLVWDQGV